MNRLRVVAERPDVLKSPDEMLALTVPELLKAEAAVARLRNIVAVQGRLLAKERGVAFIREEKLRQEFGQ